MKDDCERRPDPKQIVADGYNHIAERHAAWAGGTRAEEREQYVSVLLDRLPAGARVLELGCGVGIPTTQLLAQRFQVTGVDIAERHISLARRNVPGATFLQADMAELDFAPESLDAVAAFYSIIHLPRAEHGPLLASIGTWLRPGGLLVASLGTRSVEAEVDPDWMGAPMYWSTFDSATNRGLVQAAGLEILSAREETADEDGRPITFLWVVAQKPAARSR